MCRPPCFQVSFVSVIRLFVSLIVATEPANGILHDLSRDGFGVNGVGLMPRPEIKHFAIADLPNRAAAKEFTSVPTFFEYDLIRVRNVKRLIIHFRVLERELYRNVFGDGMVG